MTATSTPRRPLCAVVMVSSGDLSLSQTWVATSKEEAREACLAQYREYYGPANTTWEDVLADDHCEVWEVALPV